MDMKTLRLLPVVLLLVVISNSSCGVSAKALTGLIVPTDDEMKTALSQALTYGTRDAATGLSTKGGFLNSARFRIPFPPDAKKVADAARKIGLGDKVDEFETRLNRGAEDAAYEAIPLFEAAIRGLTINDARGILLGPENSATVYFQDKTTMGLTNLFAIKIKTSLDRFEATKYWSDLTGTYNKLPGVTPVETDLVRYVTGRALSALFTRLGEEEAQIRSDIKEQPTAVLKKVFGWVAVQKGEVPSR